MNDKLIRQIITSVSTSLEILYKEDGASLISKIIPPAEFEKMTTAEKKDYQHAAERAIVFRWAYYLNTLLEPKFKAASDGYDKPYKIDLEYNRHNFRSKRLENKSFFPDLIIHRRDTPDNLLVVECKGWWCATKKEITDDKDRLKKLTKQTGDFRYQLGLFIKFEKNFEATFDNLLLYWRGKEYERDIFLSLLLQGNLQ